VERDVYKTTTNGGRLNAAVLEASSKRRSRDLEAVRPSGVLARETSMSWCSGTGRRCKRQAT